MIHPSSRTKTAPLKLAVLSTSLVGAFALVAVAVGGPANAAPTDPPLGTTAQFGVLAGAGITNTGATVIQGDIGSFPTTSITGGAAITITGTNRGGDSVVQGAKPDLVTAYNGAAGAGPQSATPADLGGETLVAGVYGQAETLQLTGTVTLDGQNDPDSVFIFQAGSSLTTASGSSVSLINGAQACHVYWQVGSSATIGTGTSFKGNILALTSIFANSTATFEGRLLARNGEVTLNNNVITRPGCEAAVETTPTPTATGGTETDTEGTTAGGTETEGTTADSTTTGTEGTTADSTTTGDAGGADTTTENVSSENIDTQGADTGGAGAGSESVDDNNALPDTGGPPRILLLVGAAALVVGGAVTMTSHRRARGAQRKL